MSLLDQPRLALHPVAAPPSGAIVRVPGSKSLTNRALVLAALADGPSTLSGVLESDDTLVMLDALRGLGFDVEHDRGAATVRVVGKNGAIPSRGAELFVGNSGTSLRFLTALCCLGQGTYRLDGVPRMRERPVADLLMALNRLGADARSEAGTGCPPVEVRADRLDGGWTEVRGDVSSQFLSGLLMVLPRAKGPTTVEVQGTLVSKPYIAMTLEAMEAFGVRISNRDFRRFNVELAKYRPQATYAIEPDASAAGYWFAAAAITGGSITVEGLGTRSIQGDMALLDVLESMGCRVERTPASTTVHGGPLRAVDVDMNPISDAVMTLAAVALFADGITRIRNVGHIRHKETDRIAAVAAELRKLGATVDETGDGLLIVPPARVEPASIATYDDHRMAMAFALVGLRAEGVVIKEPGCVAKTYPGFWDDLARVAPGSVAGGA